MADSLPLRARGRRPEGRLVWPDPGRGINRDRGFARGGVGGRRGSAQRPALVPKVKAVEEAGDAQWTLSHKPVPLRAPTELTVEHLEVEPPSRLTLREEDEASIFNVEYRLTPIGVGTRFTQISEFEWSGCRGSFTGPLRVAHVATYALSFRG
jgi:hypothetical protein